MASSAHYVDDASMHDERTEEEVIEQNSDRESDLELGQSEDDDDDDDDEGGDLKRRMYNNPDCNNNISRCLRVVPLDDVQVNI
jgi:hypothetical protein